MKILTKIKSLPIGVKATATFFLANVISSGIMYIATPIFTRLLTPEEYGSASVFMTWQQVLGILAMFCLSYGVFNNGMVDYPQKRSEYSASMLGLSSVITLCVAAALCVVFAIFGNILQLKPVYILAMFAVFLTQPAYNFWMARNRYEYKYKNVFTCSIFVALLPPLFAIISIISFPSRGLDARILGAEITYVVIYLLFYLDLLRKEKFKIKTTYWKEAFKFNLPLIPHYLSFYLLTSSDKVMISRLVGDASVAYYSISHAIATVLSMVWNAINSALIPYTYENCKTRNYKAISIVTTPILLGFGGICVIFILLAPEIISIMGTADYMEAVFAVPPIVGGAFFQATYYIFANILYFYKKPKYVMFSSSTSAIFNILLNFIFIRKFGYIAAGYTSMFCFLLQAIIDFWAMKKVVGEFVYNLKFLSSISLSVIFIAVFSNYLYFSKFLRYATLLAIIILLICFSKKILSTLASIRSRNSNEGD